MKSYTIHIPPNATGQAAAEGAVFVKDGFCWPALFIPVLWLLWRRMWLVLVLYIVAAGIITAAAAPLGDTPGAAIAILFAFAFAFEANNLRRWSLERRGFHEAGCSAGRTLEEAEIRYFCDDRPAAPAAPEIGPGSRAPSAHAAPARAPAGMHAATEPAVLGSLPEKEG